MGKQNRQRRAAKEKVRRQANAGRDQSRATPGDGSWWVAQQAPRLPDAEEFGTVILQAARESAHGNTAAAKECANRLVSDHELHIVVEKAAALAAQHVISRVVKGGWLPADLHQAARRRVDKFAQSYLVDTLAAYIQPFAAVTVHPVWREQLDEAGAVTWWSQSKPHLGQWAAKHILTPAEALTTVVEVIAMLMTMHDVGLILPLPGTASAQRPVARHGVDEKKLSRVRALLAKAESSSFPEEAEALSAKAQELMTRYALDRVLVEADTSAPDIPGSRRLWLETPYVEAKSLLVNVVAKANRCRAIFDPQWGYVSVVGDENDLDSVELLITSLLVQATRAMVASGQNAGRGGEARSRSFRQSFLVAYATRIGERLEKATENTIAHAADSARLLPVLASHQQKVDSAFSKLFPSVVGKSVSVSNRAGWGAGRAAADRAQLDNTRTAIDG